MDIMKTAVLILPGVLDISLGITLDVMNTANRLCQLAARPALFDVTLTGTGRRRERSGSGLEVGPLARMWINDKPLSPIGQKFFADMFGVRAETFRQIGEDPAFSIMGRNVARVEEVYQTLGMIEYWLHELEPGAQTFALRSEERRVGKECRL